jgi:3-methyl-2-oxobutanoate hydroxymethyltransferase
MMTTTRSPATLLAGKRAGEKLTALTAYDYPLGRLLDEAGIDIILVGDSLGMVVLGYPDTTAVTVDDIVHHTRAVARGVKRALLVADLPARSYETPAAALENACRLMAAGAHAVKLEGGACQRAQIAAIVAAGIPVMGHIGMLPQHVREEGGYKIKGRSDAEIEALIADGRAVEEAGAFAVVLEIVTPAAARRVTAALAIPTIGIGSGDGCDGQILVTPDLLGLFPWFAPKFVTPQAQLAGTIREAVARYIQATKSQAGHPAPAQT